MFKFTLRAARVSCGYTVEQVAKYCVVSSNTIRKYESNPSRLPLYLIIQLSGLYGVSPNSIVLPFIIGNDKLAPMMHK